MRKIKRFEVDSFDSLVYAVSLVDEPAIESGYKYFNNEKRMVQLADEEKHVVVGAVLIPDKEIYRYDESTGMEYFLVFSRKAVKDLSEKFLKDGFANNWTLDHQYGAEGVYTVESWIKEDMEKDKSVALGIDPSLPVGTWFMATKINDYATWEEVKAGRWQGFSVEAYVSLIETELSKQNKNEEVMNESKKETFFEKVKNIFNELFDTDTEQVAEELEATPEVEEPAPEEEPEAEDEPLDVAEPEEVAEAEEEAIEHLSAIAKLEEENAKLQSQVEQLLAKVEELRQENEKLAKQPSAKPVEVKASKQDSVSDRMEIIRQLHEGTYFNK